MELKEIQKQVAQVFLEHLEKDKIALNDDYLILKIGEEVGELMQAYLVYKKRCRPEKYLSDEEAKKGFAKELADVIGLVFAIATVMDIDLDQAIIKKWISKEWIKRK
ncbi:MAG: hypothetical protein V1819_00785 [bacterium]